MFPIENPMNMARYATLMVGFACLVAAAEPAEPGGGNPAKPEENRGGTGQATVTVNLKAGPKPYSTMIFGGFLEHFDRQIYGGVFEPGSPLSDQDGFRKDVIEALKELKVPGKEYIERVRDAAIAMKQVDPSIQVTCSGAHGPNARMDPYLFQTAGKHLDLISVHEYWIANFQKHHTPDYLTCMMLAEKPDAHFGAAIRSLEGGAVRGRIRIAFDEWNLRSWHHPGFSGHQARKVDYADPAVIALIKAWEKSSHPSLYTMADALFCASFFNACLRHSEDVAMANIAPLVNTTGPLFVHPHGIVKRTHFHTMAMYANLLEDHVADTRVTASRLTHGDQSVAAVDAVATVDKSRGKWAIALVNRHPAGALDCHVLVDGTPLDSTFMATLLAGDSPDAHNDIGHPDRVSPQESVVSVRNGILRLPPHSLMIISNQSAARR